MNSRRMNRLEELGRVDAEKAYTKKGKRNLGAEKSRIVSELKSGGKVKDGSPSFNYDKDHPKVQSLKKFINKNREEKNKKPLNKFFSKVGLISKSKQRPMTDQEAKKLADKIQTSSIKKHAKTEGSFKDGGRVNNKTKPKKPLSGSMKKPKPGSQSYQFLQTQKPRPTTSKRGGGLATRGMGAAMQNGGRVMGKGQGRVMRKRPTFNISMKRS